MTLSKIQSTLRQACSTTLRGVITRVVWFAPLLMFTVASALFPDSHGTGWHFALYLVVAIAILGFAVSAVICVASLFSVLIRRTPPGPLARRAYQFVVAGLVVWMMAFSAAALIPKQLPRSYQLDRFDKALWLSSGNINVYETSLAPRQRMLGSTLSMLKGRSRSEIEDLLGKSLEIPRFSTAGVDLIYFVGPDTRSYTFGVDAELLLIQLDENERFAEYTLGVQGNLNPGRASDAT